jgi:malate/lactate dehydrogenase
MKIGVIGTGAVGSACTFATVMRGCAREIVLVNRNRTRSIAGRKHDVTIRAHANAAVSVHGAMMATPKTGSTHRASPFAAWRTTIMGMEENHGH